MKEPSMPSNQPLIPPPLRGEGKGEGESSEGIGKYAIRNR